MSEAALLSVRAALAAVLCIAGLAKLADTAGSRQAMLGFGVPQRLARPLGLGLAVTELIVGLALIPAVTAELAAYAAAGLLLLFLVAVGYQLARGRHPDCHCFGQLHSKPIGRGTVVRNAGLLSLAVFVAVNPTPSWTGAAQLAAGLSSVEAILIIALALLLAVVAAQGWMLLNLARQQGRLMLRLDAVEAQPSGRLEQSRGETGRAAGLPVGAAAPGFELPSLAGRSVSLGELRAGGHPILLVSMDPQCGPCTSLIPEVAEWQRAHAGALTVAVLTRGSVEANTAKFENHGVSRILLQQKQEVAQQYAVVATPSAVLVASDGRIAAPVAAGADEIRRLVERTLNPPYQRAEGLPIGSVAPRFTLPDLDGVPFGIPTAQPTVLLFWNPSCGFCRRMVPDLKSWESRRQGDTGLVLISSGTAEANRDMGLQSPVLLEKDFTVGRRYGASGTPSAVLIDRSGRVASTLTVGASGVLALVEQLEPSKAVIESA